LSYTLISPSSIDLCFFTVRQPPTSTLFPYTTLFRSQETRAELAQLSAEVVEPQGWHVRLCPALAKGRAGVALYSRREPDAVRVGFGVEEFDGAGRYVEADLGSVTVASLYLPSGEVGTERQQEKERFMKSF